MQCVQRFFLRGLSYVCIEKTLPYSYSNLLPVKEVCYPSWPLSHSATLTEWLDQPLSHSATLPATQPLPERLNQPLSHSATLPEWLDQPLSHSATVPEWLDQPLSHSATLPESGWTSHSATQPLSRVAGPATQPLSHSARVAGPATQPLSHSGRVAEWLSGWGDNFRHCAFNHTLDNHRGESICMKSNASNKLRSLVVVCDHPSSLSLSISESSKDLDLALTGGLWKGHQSRLDRYQGQANFNFWNPLPKMWNLRKICVPVFCN